MNQTHASLKFTQFENRMLATYTVAVMEHGTARVKAGYLLERMADASVGSCHFERSYQPRPGKVVRS